MKKEKTEIRYFTSRDIIQSIRQCREWGVREKAFDWKEIAVRGFINRHKVLSICKRYGKVSRHLRGFSIRFYNM